jgi:uncharacterized membrane protein SpoIIM required for sporulation
MGRLTVAVDADGTPARSIADLYRRGVPLSLRRMRVPLLLTAAVFTLAFAAGFVFGQIPAFQLPLPDEAAYEGTQEIFANFQTEGAGYSVGFILWQNGRVLLGSLLLAAFSFGVFAFVIPPLTFAVLGYLFSQMLLTQYNLSLFFGALLPHGIIEIAAIALATAAMFRLGSVITRPPAGQTIGQAWLIAVGDLLKVTLTLIAPMLVIAAFLEVYVTPAVVNALLAG